MTQPIPAVEGAAETSPAGTPASLEDRFADLAAASDGEAEDAPETGDRSPPVGAAGAGDDADEPAPGAADPEGEADLPITPPVSWNAAEKAEFAQLPRALQETLTRREAERERFVQAKAQEARHARSQVEREALSTIRQLQARYAEHLEHFEAELGVAEPDPRLIAHDPDLYAAQLDEFRYHAAQREQLQQLRAQAQQQSALAEREIAARDAEETRSVLAERFPEYLDPGSGPKLRQGLGSTALELGYSPDQLAQVDHTDILAMRMANEWRTDALKYRALMARKAETVRAAREMPRVSRPGIAPVRGAADNQRYAADRQKMKQGDRDAALRTFARFL